MPSIAGTTETGRDRLHVAVAEIHEILMPTGVKPIRPLDAREGRRLAETVRGSPPTANGCWPASPRSNRASTTSPARSPASRRPRGDAAAAAAARARPQPPPSSRQRRPEDVTSSINPPAAASNVAACRRSRPRAGRQPRPNSASTSAAPRTVEALRTAWTAALRRHGTLLEGLRPVVQMRERARPGGMELRLIAGPLPTPRRRRGFAPA